MSHFSLIFDLDLLFLFVIFFFFFFKQKTAYEVRLSDWISDGGSSDPPPQVALPQRRQARDRYDCRHRHAQQRQDADHSAEQHQGEQQHRTREERQRQPRPQRPPVVAAPAQQRSRDHHQAQGQRQRSGDLVVIGRPDRNPFPQRLGHDRIEGAEQHQREEDRKSTRLNSSH